MREILSISIDSQLKNKVEIAAKKFNISKSELVKNAIKKYILHQELDNLRETLIPHAERSGFFTDEDIFNEFS